MLVRLNFKRYYKNSDFHVKSFLRILVIIWLSKKYFTSLRVQFYTQKKYKKIYTFVKGPKCHKRGKELFQYSYNRSSVLLYYSSLGELDILQNYRYFIFLNRIFKNFTTGSFYQHRFDFFNMVNTNFIK